MRSPDSRAGIPRVVALVVPAILGFGLILSWRFGNMGGLLGITPPGDPRLAAFVLSRPSVPIVFTSRSDISSFLPAAPEGDGYRFPGQPLWQAREGRLRLLAADGRVLELTWGKPLPDGDTLIDVMSPSVSPDGLRILFAGRRRDDGHGRFRLYEVGVDGRGLRQLTGGQDDPGCDAVPPLRWDAQGRKMPDEMRRKVDYDDVDPVELNDAGRGILFASSRSPDLGRDHSRRSTALWLRGADGSARPVSANRNNDRWPFLLKSGYSSYTSWSRNREVVTEDGKDIAPVREGIHSLTRPTDQWEALFVQIPGGHFGFMAKVGLPTWRVRPLFANRLVFMTTKGNPRLDGSDPLTVAQVAPGSITRSPSSTAGTPIDLEPVGIRFGPAADADGRPLWLATPGAFPPDRVVLSAASGNLDGTPPEAGRFGLFSAKDDWPEQGEPPSLASVDWRAVFDDPDMVDAEPVAALHRGIPRQAESAGIVATVPDAVRLEDGTRHGGPFGHLFATALGGPTMMAGLPGQNSDSGQGPIYESPPSGSISHLRIYAARRDRFYDAVVPRIPGDWSLILKLPVSDGASSGLIPANVPTVLAGFGRDGKIVEWGTHAKDSRGRSSRFYAFAGDHYSLAQPHARHFCVGCHAGHSGLPPEAHQHAERLTAGASP